MRRWIALLVMAGILLAGCSFSKGPIDPNWGLALLPGAQKLAFFDPATQKVMREIPMRGHFFMDYAIAPNGKIYIPLNHTPGQPENYLGILDRQTGQIKKVPVPVKAVTSIQILEDGTAFVGSGSLTRENDVLALLFDTNTDQVLGRIAFPLSIGQLTRLSETEILIPMDDNSDTGRILIARRDARQMSDMTDFFPFPVEPSAPKQIQFAPDGKRLYLLYVSMPKAHPKRERLRAEGMDERLLTQHISVWELPSFRLIRRIFLPVPMPTTMLLGPDGRLYVGYFNMAQPVEYLSVVDPESGQIENVPTVANPKSVQIHGEYLYAASETTMFLDVFRLSDLTRLGRIEFNDAPIVARRRL